MAHINFLFDFIRNSEVKFVNNGGSGVGFLIEVKNREFMNTEPFLFKNVTLDYCNSSTQGKVDKMFIKLQILSDSNSGRFNFTALDRHINSVPGFEFVKECDMQKDIFKKSNHNLSPLCPPIFCCMIEKSGSQLFDLLKNNCNDTKYQTFFDELKYYVGVKSYHSLGVIVMPVLSGNTLNSFGTHFDYEIQTIAKLVNLYNIGYIHNDAHRLNIFINPSEKYTKTKTGKSYLIDFGLSAKHTFNKDITNQEKLNNIITTKNRHNYNMETWPSYQWIPRRVGIFANDQTKNKYLKGVNDIQTEMDDYENFEVDRNLKCRKRDVHGNTHSSIFEDILVRVRAHNGTTNSGGAVTNPLSTTKKLKVSTKTTSNGKNIKNTTAKMNKDNKSKSPQPLMQFDDLNVLKDIGDKYIDCLNFGTESLNKIKKELKKPKTTSRRTTSRRSSRNTSRNSSRSNKDKLK
jgi:hypothetical protein